MGGGIAPIDFFHEFTKKQQQKINKPPPLNYTQTSFSNQTIPFSTKPLKPNNFTLKKTSQTKLYPIHNETSRTNQYHKASQPTLPHKRI